MQAGIILSIAKTHLLSRLKQSVIASLGVTFGIGMFIAMVSFMTGVNAFLEDMILDNTAHIHIYNEASTSKKSVLDLAKDPENNFNMVWNTKPKDVRQNIKDGLQILRIVRSNPKVEGASPLLTSQVFYNYGSTPINGSISGVDILEQDKLFNLSGKLIAGEIKGLLSINNGIIIGSGLAKKLEVGVNDHVNITTPRGTQMRLIIVGIYSTGIAAMDNTMSYSTLKTSQRILEKNNDYITDINIKLKNIDDAAELAKTYTAQFEAKADDWITTNAEILVSFTMRNTITYAVSIALLIVAAFGIYNILTMMIYEKMNDIAILKATGFTGSDVLKIFLSEALIIGIVGGISGLIFGFFIAYGISKIPFNSTQVITLTHMPVNFDIEYYIFGMLFALITTALAGFLPSRRAAKVDPVAIIRGK
jgi:lipoprotein-releasing system permease protein